MKVIRADLPQNIDILELHTFADEHIGDNCCDLPRLKARIDYVAATPNAYCIMNGDILDYATRNSIGDIEAREFNIMEQLEKAIELFTPIKDKIIAITNGNHEAQLFTVYVNHGAGGGRKEGAKAIRLADMASIIDADVYIHSHTHLPMVMKQGYFRIDTRNSCVANVTKLFVNTAANLNYGGYGEAGEFKPNSKDTPVIYLSANRKEMCAKL